MAFVCLRGHCAQLLATVYEEGRSRQVVVSAIPEAGWLTPGRREYIATRWPQLRLDWAAVDRALAAGPPGSPPPFPQAAPGGRLRRLCASGRGPPNTPGTGPRSSWPPACWSSGCGPRPRRTPSNPGSADPDPRRGAS